MILLYMLHLPTSCKMDNIKVETNLTEKNNFEEKIVAVLPMYIHTPQKFIVTEEFRKKPPL